LLIVNYCQNKDVLEHTLKNLSSEARAQATTAWCIEAMEQHSKLLHMVLEREAEVYANAASEPLNTSVKELVNCKLEDQKECTIAVYDDDTTSFAEADAELDHMETFVCAHFYPPANDVTLKISRKQLTLNQVLVLQVWMKTTALVPCGEP